MDSCPFLLAVVLGEGFFGFLFVCLLGFLSFFLVVLWGVGGGFVVFGVGRVGLLVLFSGEGVVGFFKEENICALNR